MKSYKFIIIAAIVILTFYCSRALAIDGIMLDKVDIGDPSTEINHDLMGWGPIEPATNGGSWGGIYPGNCRVIWDSSDDNPTACLTLSTPKGAGKNLVIRHLDGIADDSLNVYVWHPNGEWRMVGSYYDMTSAETWKTFVINLENQPFSIAHGKNIKVMLEATGNKWSGFNTYGQVAYDSIELWGNGSPNR